MGQQIPLDLPYYVQEVIKVLASNGYQSYVVGGAIRDFLLGIPIRDWDIATDAPPAAITSLFPRVILTGVRHGTVTVRISGQSIEVSTFRGGNIIEDLAHRDFTIDAMAFDPMTGVVLDPFGGRQDINSRTLRAVGRPDDRFKEDPLRALRGARLAAELGFDLDPDTKQAMSRSQCTPERISVERIREELDRILLTPDPEPALHLVWESGIVWGVIPELSTLQPQHGDQMHPWRHVVETVRRLSHVLPLRWAGLLHRLGAAGSPDGWMGKQELGAMMSACVLKRLRASRKMTEQASAIIKYHSVVPQKGLSEGEVRVLLCELGYPLLLWALELRIASLEAHGGCRSETTKLRELLERVKEVVSDPDGLKSLAPVLNGNDVMEILGLKPGPKVGDILTSMKALVARTPQMNNRETLTRWLKEHYSGRP